MASWSKAEYILRSLTKIRNKRWEYFVVSRIYHKLDDDDIEFITQQLVRLPNGRRALTDMYFPQFDLHLEVDEGHHLREFNAEADEYRSRDIVLVTKHGIERILVALIVDGQARERPLQLVKHDVDAFVEKVRAYKTTQVQQGIFRPWNFDDRYSPKQYIDRGYVAVADNVVFRLQADALRCFGFEGEGYQRAVWKIHDDSGDVVWFPRLYSHGVWENEISPDGKFIYERATNDESRQSIQAQLQSPGENYIIFARAINELGHALYRYVGTFRMNTQESNQDVIRFDLVRDVENIRRRE